MCTRPLAVVYEGRRCSDGGSGAWCLAIRGSQHRAGSCAAAVDRATRTAHETDSCTRYTANMTGRMDGSSPDSPPLRSRTDSGTGDTASDPSTTPTRRNKRKMTAPKRRTDFSIKRFCPEISDSVSDVELEDYDDMGREYVPDTPAPSTPSPSTSSPDPDDRLPMARSAASTVGRARATPLGLPISKEGSAVTPFSMGRIDLLGGNPPGPHSGDMVHGHTPHLNGHNLSLGQIPEHATRGSHNLLGGLPISSPPSPADSTSSMADSSGGGKKTRKNYKNMTRERRVEANARERSRVHTISAAFDSLRQAVPSYSYNQKLSKLAILRIACSYILSLARLADLDYSMGQRNYSFADCVDMCTRVIQTEGRARRRH